MAINKSKNTIAPAHQQISDAFRTQLTDTPKSKEEEENRYA
jgi:hypothetical protein